MIIRIPNIAYLWARQEARRRLARGTRAGHIDWKRDMQMPPQERLKHEVRTTMGEVGAAIALRVDYRQIPGWDATFDLMLADGRTVEVKSVVTDPEPAYPYLIMSRGRELTADIGMLVCPRASLETVRIIGWCDQEIWQRYREWGHKRYDPNFQISSKFLQKDLTSLRMIALQPGLKERP